MCDSHNQDLTVPKDSLAAKVSYFFTLSFALADGFVAIAAVTLVLGWPLWLAICMGAAGVLLEGMVYHAKIAESFRLFFSKGIFNDLADHIVIKALGQKVVQERVQNKALIFQHLSDKKLKKLAWIYRIKHDAKLDRKALIQAIAKSNNAALWSEILDGIEPKQQRLLLSYIASEDYQKTLAAHQEELTTKKVLLFSGVLLTSLILIGFGSVAFTHVIHALLGSEASLLTTAIPPALLVLGSIFFVLSGIAFAMAMYYGIHQAVKKNFFKRIQRLLLKLFYHPDWENLNPQKQRAWVAICLGKFSLLFAVSLLAMMALTATMGAWSAASATCLALFLQSSKWGDVLAKLFIESIVLPAFALFAFEQSVLSLDNIALLFQRKTWQDYWQRFLTSMRATPWWLRPFKILLGLLMIIVAPILHFIAEGSFAGEGAQLLQTNFVWLTEPLILIGQAVGRTVEQLWVLVAVGSQTVFEFLLDLPGVADAGRASAKLPSEKPKPATWEELMMSFEKAEPVSTKLYVRNDHDVTTFLTPDATVAALKMAAD